MSIEWADVVAENVLTLLLLISHPTHHMLDQHFQPFSMSSDDRTTQDFSRMPLNLKTWAREQSQNHAHPPTGQSTIAKARADTVSERFGMVTPPDGTTAAVESRPSIPQASTWSSTNDKSEKARKAANKRHSKDKSRRMSMAAAETDQCIEGEVETEEKKEHYREKNKIAAAKCRNKKRRLNDEIETQARDLESANKTLKAELMDLRNVMILLKDQILRHSPQDCNCKPLHEYSMAQATRMLQHSSAQRMADNSIMPQFSQPHHVPMRTQSIMSTGSSVAMRTPVDDPQSWASMSEGASGVMTGGGRHSDMIREDAFGGQPFMTHHFVGNHNRYMSGDDLRSMHSASVSPVDMTGFADQDEFGTSSGGDMYHGTPFPKPWEFAQQN